MPDIRFDRYYRYDALTDLLRAFEAEYPGLVRLESIGRSHEGKDIWLVTLTNFGDANHDVKPAFWVDGNIHASEVSASTAALYLIHQLVTGYGSDPQLTRALDTRTFYVCPRLNPDGAEWALEDVPRIVRSGTRNYPYSDEDPAGLETKDMDGDGRVLNMRVKDSNGAWVVSEQEPRLLRRRRAGEVGGTYYRLMPEGAFHNFDGLTMRRRRTPQGLDFNRNFPSAWRIEQEQYGAGDFPASEPEIRAAVSAIVARPNICGAVTFHTYSGVHLRPPSRMPDDEIPAEDLWIYKEFGEVGEEMTGYPAISNYHEFRYHPKEVITGVFDDWMYEHRGVFAWTTELWSPQREAGITDYKYIDWFRDHPFEDDLALLKWSDEKLEGRGHVDWYPFDHPQLGPIELGGWDSHYAFRNPPPQFLEREVSRHAGWVVWQALASPKLELRATEVIPVGSAWKIRVAVQNTGFLPTNVSAHAQKKGLVRGVIGEINRPDSPVPTSAPSRKPEWLVSGEIVEDCGQLLGYSHVTAGGFGWQMNGTDDVAVFEWVIQGSGDYEITVRHERAGTVKVKVNV